MSFIDKVSNILRMDYNQDDYDDYDEDFDDDFDEDEEETRQPERVSRTSYRDKYEDEDDEPSYSKRSSHAKSSSRSSFMSKSSNKNARNVVPMRSSGLEVCVIKPSGYDETKEIIDTLLQGKAVIVNLEGVKLDLAQRIVDTVYGASYSIGGKLQKITGYIYIVTSSNVDLSGDFHDAISSSYNNMRSTSMYK